ncbi:LysE family translocator [Neptunomonas sp.]|uniref:LysE family translocator n=1 Tax=Neptunomonas sp. TaxID=1971898 RepID=UPI003563BF6A
MLNIDHFELYSVAIITLLAVISPGPDFAVMSKVALLKGRRAGILCALGIGVAISVHLAYTLIGLGVVFANNIWVLNTLRYLGALYLIWLGISALWPDIKKILSTKSFAVPQRESTTIAAKSSAFWTGFACNALNPKTMLFIVSLFSQVISDDTPLVIELGYGFYIAFIHFIWFGSVACLLTSVKVQKKVLVFKGWIERVTGVFLMSFGMRLLAGE